ncbi:hypothetical protein GH714_029457 [Hevea brasiliensis]|uniref:GPN-loop GTPase 3 n=1 Tax=Hevea brasiliensis TaxID=3981 RepID=A0A6A6K7K6_HEVBR|nr:hypothetical protein GH714_029457 [Hevea brasiliensis]
MQISTLLDGLQKYWPSLSCGSSSTCHEKHGTCSSPVVQDEYSYFVTVLNLFFKYNVTKVLNEAGYIPSNTEKYPLGGIVSTIENAFHTTPSLICSRDAVEELHLCFYKDFKPRDCVVGSIIQDMYSSRSSCPKYVSLPLYFSSGLDVAETAIPWSTYCSSLYQHCEIVGRSIHIVNLDPAAEHFDYPVAMDIRELISLDDVMEELGLGPNGALIYCMEELEDNLDDWLTEELDNYRDDDYLVFDCPGQIELFSHVPVLRNFVKHLKRKNFNVCAVYLIDSQFITDVTKFISGCMDLFLQCYLNPEPRALLSELNQRMAPQFLKLNKALIELVDEYSMVNFVPLDLKKESSIQYVLAQIDNCIQYGEDADVKVRDFDPEDEE